MCDPVSIAMMAFSAVSKIGEGQQKARMYEYQREQASADANAEREQGQVKAEKIRKAAQGVRSQATAALAASGVEIGAGTPARIDQEIVRRNESDALQEILSGTRAGARMDQQAGLYADAAGRAESSGWRNAFGSVLSIGGQTLPGWGRQAPAPVEERSIVRIR